MKALYVVAFVVVGERGEGAVVYGAQDASDPNPLLICDFDAAPVGPTTFAGIATRLQELDKQCRTSSIAIWCDETLIRFARVTGLPAHPIPEGFDAEAPRSVCCWGSGGRFRQDHVERSPRRPGRARSPARWICARAKGPTIRCGMRW